MRRLFVISTSALALALLPAVGSAQTAPAEAPAAQAPAPEKPALFFSSSAGLLLVQVKPDQTANFEEMVAKMRSALGTTADVELKAKGAAFRVYKSQEGMGGNSLYVIVVDPATPDSEYYPLQLINKTLTDDQKRDPETQAMFKRFADVFAGVNKLNLTPLAGGM